MKKYVAELFGTFALVFCGTGAVIINQETNGSVSHVGVSITFGFIVMAMIYALGRISGAHLNPAVTIAFTLAKRFPLQQVVPYITAQLSGATVATLILKFLFPANETPWNYFTGRYRNAIFHTGVYFKFYLNVCYY